ncbi:hypothetical protein BJ912DRAFT_947921 [Pholiota molesta]|nr:hypothetical protein BJ912DRAFT_947921 [Pholiota molesta]
MTENAAAAATGGELSTWFSPWAWYSSATGASIANQPNMDAYAPERETEEEKEITGTTRLPPIDDNPPPPTQDPETTLAPPSSPPPELEAEPINPISASISQHTSSWASFFSSRALVGRTLGYGVGAASRAIENVQRDENGVEVMEVDFDEDGQGLENTPGAEAQRGRGGEPKPVGGASSSRAASASAAASLHPAASPPRTPSPRVASITRAPPLQISAEVRKDSARLKLAGSGSSSRSASAANTPVRGRSPALDGARTASLPSSAATNAPGSANTTSTTSAAGTSTTTATSTSTSTLTTTTTATTTTRPASPTPTLPAKKPAPPNLVLPTWADTFHVAPRSIPPPRPKPTPIRGASGDTAAAGGGGMLGKTLHFMNHVLFAKDSASPSAHAHAPDTSAKGKGREKGKGKERVVQRTFSAGSEASMASDDGEQRLSLLEQDRRARFAQFGRALPKAWRVVDGVDIGAEAGVGADGGAQMEDVLRGCRRVVVIGVHGWFPGAMIRTVLGEPTGTSTKFASMMEQALHAFEAAHGVHLDKITQIPLEGDGTIARRVEKLYANLQANAAWMADLHAADAVLVATHSQGSVVSTHLLARLIRDGHIVTARSRAASAASDAAASAAAMDAGGGMAALALGMGGEAGAAVDAARKDGDGAGVGGLVHRKVQRVCVLALCGIHLGPLRYLSSSTLVGPYLQYFESTAARELFEFQNTESAVSKAYVAALNTVLDHGTKIVYVASLNDQVVPIYSGLFTAASHPLILRALYIDGDAYHSSDFLSNLLVLLLRILNAGMSDSGLLAHLSEATAGSLNGVGHSTAYEEVATYSLAVQYLFMANEGVTEESRLEVEPFNATQEQNDYEIPWSLREVIADERVAYFFGKEIAGLRDAFREWHPKTTILRDLKRKLQPIQRLSSTFSAGTGTSKL